MPLSLEEMSRRAKIHLIRNKSRQMAWMTTAGVFLVASYALGLNLLSPSFAAWAATWGLLARLGDQAALFHADRKILGYRGS